jgi:hypothetical protein
MTAQDKRLKALGAALRAKLKDGDELPHELESLLLRLLLRENNEASSHRRRARA